MFRFIRLFVIVLYLVTFCDADGETDATEAAAGAKTGNLDTMMEQMASSGSAGDQAMMKEMFASLKGQQDALKQQTEELQKMKAEQMEKMAAMEGQLAQRHEFKQPPMEKITKKDGSSFYTRIVSSDDPPMGNWPEGEQPPPPPLEDDQLEEGNSGLALPSKQGPTTMFTMPRGRDMKEVLKEIMANDGDIRKVPGLKPWKPSDEKRNKNQIGWDDDENANDDDDDFGFGGEEDDVNVEDDGDGTGIVPRNKGAATSLSDANHQISMLKIDLQTLKQEKTMKEKSAALQISNLKQKLAKTQHLMEDLKISSRRDQDAAKDLRRRIDELEEELAASKKSLSMAQSELLLKQALEEEVADMKAEARAQEDVLKEKEALVAEWQRKHEQLGEAVKALEKANQEKDVEWNSRWAEYSKKNQASLDTWQENLEKEKKKTQKVLKQKEKLEEDLETMEKSLEDAKKQVSEASEAAKQREEALKSLTSELKAAEAELTERRSRMEEVEQAAAAAVGKAAVEVAEVKAAAAAEKVAQLEAQVVTLKKQSEQFLPIIVGLVSTLLLLLLCQMVRVCCCGGNKKIAASPPLARNDHPDVKSFRAEDVAETTTTTTTTKKAKKKEKKNE